MCPSSDHSAARVAVLISGRGSNLAAILERQATAGLGGGRVVVVMSNKPDAPGLAHARRHGLPIEVIDHREFERREEFDAALAERLESYRPDLVVLAGFMRILTGAFTRRFENRLINTHPSLLPKFPGMDAVGQALDAGVNETGCTVHFVTEEVDAGPILAQRRVEVRAGDTRETLEARVLAVEHQLLPDTITRFCSGELDAVT